MLKYGATREDGFRFRAYEKRGGKVYENWLSPEAWKRRQEQRAARLKARRQTDPELRAKHVAATRKSQEKCRRERPALHLWRRAKAGAKVRGLEFDLRPEDIVIPAVCPVLGIPLALSSDPIADGSPSVDRIRNDAGYLRGNIVVVSRRANVLKRDATPEELRAVASFYTELTRRQRVSKLTPARGFSTD